MNASSENQIASSQIASSLTTRTIAEINWEQVVGYRRAFFGSSLENLRRLGAAAGDIAQFTVLNQRVVMVTTPALVREALILRAEEFTVQRPDAPPPFFPANMLQSDGEAHHRKRKQVAPAFRQRHFAAYAAIVADCVERRQAGWRDGATLNMTAEMERLALNIMGKVVLGRDGMGDGDEFGQAQRRLVRTGQSIWSPLHLPLRRMRQSQVQQALATLRQAVSEGLRARQAGEQRGDDMLSVLMESHPAGDSQADEQLITEIIGVLGASTANIARSLGWTLSQIAQRPDIAARIQQEAKALPPETFPGFDDLSRLSFILQVYQEALRTLPRVSPVRRWAAVNATLGGHPIPEGALLCIFPYLMHHNSQYFPEPARFDPARFAPDVEQTWPRHAFVPFGEGAHACIGNHFTLMLAQILLAVLMLRVNLHPIRRQPLQSWALPRLQTRDDIRLRITRCCSPER